MKREGDREGAEGRQWRKEEQRGREAMTAASSTLGQQTDQL